MQDGSRVSCYDNLVLRVADQIESIFDHYEKVVEKPDAEIEIEGRLGVIRDGDRMRLPVETEVVLQPSVSESVVLITVI